MSHRQVSGHAVVENQRADVDAGFEQRLIEQIDPIRQHFLASALHLFFSSGLYDRLTDAGEHTRAAALAEEIDLDFDRLNVLLHYLANEGIVLITPGSVELTGKAHRYAEFRSWYTFLIGGYAQTLTELPSALRRGTRPCSRDGRNVGLGSCEIARYDGIPVTRALLDAAGVTAREVLDLGCGSGLYLAELCAELDGITAWGAEPDTGAFREAEQLMAHRGLGGRVSLANQGAIEFLVDPPSGCSPDLLVFGFVLQEILEQDSEQAVVELLRQVVDTFPAIDIVVVEVSHEIANPHVMRHGLARNFWNPYFLVHPFTRQRLETTCYWEALFDKAGLHTVAVTSTDPRIDSSGIEVGYLLRGPGHPTGSRR